MLLKSLKPCASVSPHHSCGPGPHYFYYCSSRHTALHASACLFLPWALLVGKSVCSSSLCFIEGIQYGAVPISFDVSYGNRELLKAISPDIIIEPFSLDTYSRKLTELMHDNIYRNTLSRNALQKSTEYLLENIGEKWDNLLT